MNHIKNDVLTAEDEALQDLRRLTDDQLETVGGGIGDTILVRSGP